LKVERESQFNTAGGSEFQVRGAAVLNDRLANYALFVTEKHDSNQANMTKEEKYQTGNISIVQ